MLRLLAGVILSGMSLVATIPQVSRPPEMPAIYSCGRRADRYHSGLSLFVCQVLASDARNRKQ